MALFNKQGKRVVVKADAKEWELIPLREIHIPQPFPKGGMFSIEQRAKVKGN